VRLQGSRVVLVPCYLGDVRAMSVMAAKDILDSSAWVQQVVL
jgi:hypothetical protein